LNAVVAAVGISAGPTLGGLITEQMSWRWIFYLNVPLGVLGLLGTWLALGNASRRAPQPFDPAGAGLLAVGLATLMVGLSFGQAWGSTSARLLTCLTVSVVALIATVVVERRVRHPIIDLTLLHNRILSAALLTFLSSFRLALLACAAFAAVDIGTALVGGHERSPAARINHEKASRIVEETLPHVPGWQCVYVVGALSPNDTSGADHCAHGDRP
jgi:hypothetical protein